VIFITGEGGSRTAPALARKPVGRLIGAFKTVSAKRINELRGLPRASFWQRNYYERIVRDDDELVRIRQYILDNPANWAQDEDNPEGR
jgi:REP element-mobilizing transposase RayT